MCKHDFLSYTLTSIYKTIDCHSTWTRLQINQTILCNPEHNIVLDTFQLMSLVFFNKILLETTLPATLAMVSS